MPFATYKFKKGDKEIIDEKTMVYLDHIKSRTVKLAIEKYGRNDIAQNRYVNVGKLTLDLKTSEVNLSGTPTEYKISEVYTFRDVSS